MVNNNNHHLERHEFALYVDGVGVYSNTPLNSCIELIDNNLCFRIATVLRLRVDDTVLLFDDIIVMKTRIVSCAYGKKSQLVVQVLAISLIKNLQQKPLITLVQGLVKKSTFEDIVYSAAQCGVTDIMPVISQKIHKAWDLEHERERLLAIMRSACEQSKSFVMPRLHAVAPLNTVQFESNSVACLLDPQGQPFVNLMTMHHTTDRYYLFLGPEGGFTSAEVDALLSNGCKAYRLGSAILRSQDAALVALGMLRTF